ncbi:hypothetical protein ABW19_dt0204504 [Dactylella cylindrospora]|nr:hypothetical protein ABW19_dt0204504 [Dactylella cylindrospora]
MFSSTSTSPQLHRSNAYSYSTLPSHAPLLIVQNTTTLHDPSSISSFSHARRHRDFNALVRKYIHQLLYGCKRPICFTPTCATCRKQLSSNNGIGASGLSWGGKREFTPLSARIIACQLATADEPYKALCPGLAGDVRRDVELGKDVVEGDAEKNRKEVGEKVDSGMRDSKSFMQGLFNTTSAKTLELHVLPPPVEVVNVLTGGKGVTVSDPLLLVESRSRSGSKTDTDSPHPINTKRHPDTQPTLTINTDKDTFSTPNQLRPPFPVSTPPAHPTWSPPPSKSRRKQSHDLSSYLTSPKNSYFTPHVNEFPPSQPQHVHRHQPRDITQKRSPENTPSRTPRAFINDDKSSTTTTSPLSVRSTVPLPQAITHFTIDIINALGNMLDKPSASLHSRREANGFLRQSCFHVFSHPENIAASFPEDVKGAKSTGVLKAIKSLFNKGMESEIIDALWKGLGELFPTVEEITVAGYDGRNEKKKIVKPSKYDGEVAAKVFIITMQVITAASPVATPEAWDACRRVRGRGTVCLDIPFENENMLRLVSRFARCWYAYGLFESNVKDAVKEYLEEYASQERQSRMGLLQEELGRDLASEVVALGVGKGGWGLAVCTLEWMRAVMLSEWDGTERPRMGGVVDVAIGFLRFLCKLTLSPLPCETY